MPRADLLSLTPDDLATLANRGLVKRAQSELDGDQVTYTLSENAAGTVSVLWSDDVHCLLPSGASLQNGKCSCSATGLCRHLIRSVLAYQREHPSAPEEAPVEAEANEETVPVATSPATLWNPAEITDEDLTKHLPATVLNRARKTWESGHVIEVTLGPRPGARFHTLGVNTRFLVPHDVRYTHCDCAEESPCVHVSLAVWAFRELAPEATSGLISTRVEPLPVPAPVLDAIENALSELAQIGVVGAGRPFLDKLTRLERDCRTQELVWPAEIVAELSRQIELHAAHNARFEPTRVAQLVGELLVRSDAIRSQTAAVPDVFVRGSARDKTTEVGAARLIGIGTQVRMYRGGVELSAFLQDTDSGAVVFVSRDFPDPKNEPQKTLSSSPTVPLTPQPFWKLAASPVVKGVGIGAIGSGQVLARGGKRAPDGEFSFGRTPLSFNFQSFEWEKLRAPLLSDNFAELDAHLSQSAPTPLRPRKAGENIYVVPIAGVENARFSRTHQEVHAILRDSSGGEAILSHPFLSRGEEGVDALHAALSSSTVRFVAGRFQRSGNGLVVSPLALIVEQNSVRSMIQPWVSPRAATPASGAVPPVASLGELSSGEAAPDPLRDFSVQLTEALGELILLGLERADERAARSWERLKTQSQSLGFSRLATPIAFLSEELARKSNVRSWDSQQATAMLLQTAVVALLMAETI